MVHYDEVIINSTYKALHEEFFRYINDNRENIKRVDKKIPFEIELKSGSKVYFVTEYDYEIWCMGRIYMFNGNKYNSGMLVDWE